ncbi:MAG: HIT family protein [Acidimicrobiia bacterium]|nr:HIT family protein [Acidimicrobiia bacterium]
MASIFSRIIDGELPGRFVWRDERCAAMLTIAPLRPGHTLVVPVDEIDHWTDCPPDLLAHLIAVAREIGRAQHAAFAPRRVALLVVGDEVPHTHLHVVPMDSLADIDLSLVDPAPDPAALDAAAVTLRTALHDLGHTGTVPDA